MTPFELDPWAASDDAYPRRTPPADAPRRRTLAGAIPAEPPPIVLEPEDEPVLRRRAREPRRGRLALAAVVIAAGIALGAGVMAGSTSADAKAGNTSADAKAAQGPLPAPPAADGEAVAVQREVSDREAELLASLRALDAVLTGWKPGDMNLRAEHRALGESKRLVKTLRAFADDLTRGHDNAGKALRAFRAALERAPEKLDAAAGVYERYAAEESLEQLKTQYAAMGEKAKVIAVRYAERARHLAVTEQDLEAKMEFVRRSRVFLDRLDTYIDLLVAGQADGGELQAYLENLDRYVGAFAASVSSFRAITDRIAAPTRTTAPPKR